MNKNVLTHLSLFSGIGGIDLAAEWAGFTSVGQVEWGDYQTKVLEKHWPEVERWRDVKEFTAESFRRRTGIEEITLLSGGFPCQPHSTAGKREASNDERDLWPEYKRIISEIKPRWVVAENVSGLLSSEAGRFFRGVLRDLSAMGYRTGWCTFPASWVGAAHRRERVFTVAYTDSQRRDRLSEVFYQKLRQELNQAIDHSKTWEGINADQNDLFSHGARLISSGGGISTRNDDGLSEGLDRLECIGNAVVPYQVLPILQVIATFERKLIELEGIDE